MPPLSADDLPALLAARLRRPLPGPASRRPFAPQLSYGRHEGPPSPHPRRAAVLLLLLRDGPLWRMPLTRRPTTLTRHAGQISLPGGRLEPGETPEQAALRECEEELGIAVSRFERLGRLTPIYIFNTDYLVTPCVAALAERPRLRPNPAEVEHLFEPSVPELLDPTRRETLTIERRGVRFEAPCLRFDQLRVWGATCMILGEFMTVLDSLQQ